MSAASTEPPARGGYLKPRWTQTPATPRREGTDPTGISPSAGSWSRSEALTPAIIYDASHCGSWVDAPDTVCATAGQHAHGSGPCRPDHAAAPDCSDPVHARLTLTYAGHDAFGTDADPPLTVTCPPPGHSRSGGPGGAGPGPRRGGRVRPRCGTRRDPEAKSVPGGSAVGSGMA